MIGYKLCRKINGRYFSYFVGRQAVGAKDLEKEYVIGQETKAEVAPLFGYSSLSHSATLVGRPVFPYEIVVLKGIAKNCCLLRFVGPWILKDPHQLCAEIEHYKALQKPLTIPIPILLHKSFIPICEVSSATIKRSLAQTNRKKGC
jgi:hypothetical protein